MVAFEHLPDSSSEFRYTLSIGSQKTPDFAPSETALTALIRAAQIPDEALAPLIDHAKEYIEASQATATRAAYRSDWRHFTTWCETMQLASLPAAPVTIILYVTSLIDEGRKYSTIQRRMSAISQAHQAAHLEPPTRMLDVRKTLAGVRRTIGTAQQGKEPLVTDDIRALVETCEDTLIDVRDRSLLLVGFAGAFRRSELVGLDVADVQQNRDGLVVLLRKSKTDQEGAGYKKGIPYGSNPETCPVRAYQDWLEVSGITNGPLYRAIDRHGRMQEGRLSDKAVALVVKKRAERAGLDPAKFAGHSLRAGLATAAAQAGVSERAIMA